MGFRRNPSSTRLVGYQKLNDETYIKKLATNNDSARKERNLIFNAQPPLHKKTVQGAKEAMD
jgi:hypothetical protein